MKRSPDDTQAGEGRGGKGRTFVLIPGSGGTAWYWHRVVPLLRQAGHEMIAVDLPGDDGAAGLCDCAHLVADAIDARRDVGWSHNRSEPSPPRWPPPWLR